MNMTAFNILCAGLIGMVLGVLITFAGYRLFLVLLPLWGFFFGLSLGANTVQWVFNGGGLFVDVTSLVVGFVVGAIFAVLSYLFYVVAVAIIAGSLGYFVAVYGLMGLGMNANFLLWLIGIIAGVVLIFLTLRFSLAKWVIIITTSLLGAAVSFGTIIQTLNPAANLLENPVKLYLSQSWFLLVLFALMAAAGIVVQYVHNKSWTVEEYNRWEAA
ncbi:MAG: hypothetical protein C3F13_00270 [Anaerolineales bacterium]|nr:DUF4203 domain-containing protein [Anaerolineae bacterium]PWB56894.1 MAG: hypothetical protein C3F13_00270 [Anaerolineales bacterium]